MIYHIYHRITQGPQGYVFPTKLCFLLTWNRLNSINKGRNLTLEHKKEPKMTLQIEFETRGRDGSFQYVVLSVILLKIIYHICHRITQGPQDLFSPPNFVSN